MKKVVMMATQAGNFKNTDSVVPAYDFLEVILPVQKKKDEYLEPYFIDQTHSDSHNSNNNSNSNGKNNNSNSNDKNNNSKDRIAFLMGQ